MEKVKITNEQEKQAAIARARELSKGSEAIDGQIENLKSEIEGKKATILDLQKKITAANEDIKKLTAQKTQAAKTNAKELAEIKAALADYTIGA